MAQLYYLLQILAKAGFSQISPSGMGNIPQTITQSFKNPSVIQRNPGESDLEFYQRAFNIKGTILSVSEPKVISTQTLNTISQSNPSIKPGTLSTNPPAIPATSIASGNSEIANSNPSSNYFGNPATSSIQNPPISGSNQEYI